MSILWGDRRLAARTLPQTGVAWTAYCGLTSAKTPLSFATRLRTS
jgi:hypothetical protein